MVCIASWQVFVIQLLCNTRKLMYCRANISTGGPPSTAGMQARSNADRNTKGHCLTAVRDKELMAYIVEGLRHGFWIGFDYAKHPSQRHPPLSRYTSRCGTGVFAPKVRGRTGSRATTSVKHSKSAGELIWCHTQGQ